MVSGHFTFPFKTDPNPLRLQETFKVSPYRGVNLVRAVNAEAAMSLLYLRGWEELCQRSA
jgi:hypothetical protein